MEKKKVNFVAMGGGCNLSLRGFEPTANKNPEPFKFKYFTLERGVFPFF